MKRVAVIGSRSFRDYPRLCRDLDRLVSVWGEFILVSGGAVGADSLGVRWAKARGLPEPVLFFPEYERYGSRAPLERNHTIVENADAVIAFWDGQSRGTAYTLQLARRAGIPVYVRS